MTSTLCRSLVPLAALAAFLLLTACTSITEDVSKHLLEHDFKTLHLDHCIVENDLSLFHGCLQSRCQPPRSTQITS